jgi:uncharacterized membrane protein YedE/YeeE
MIIDSFSTAYYLLLASILLISLVTGIVMRKTDFCSMGAVCDLISTGDTGRMKSWLLAIAIAMLGVSILEFSGLVNVDGAYSPYRSSELAWAGNLLGGLLFGIGMTLTGGCGSKQLVRLGGGNLKSVFVVIVIAFIAYYMGNPLPGTDNTLYTFLFYDWMNPLITELPGRQDLGTIISDKTDIARLSVGVVLACMLLFFVLRSSGFRSDKDHVLGGLTIGIAVICVWTITSMTSVGVDGEAMGLAEYVVNWEFISESEQGKPAHSLPFKPQSLTIINPMGQAFGYAQSNFDNRFLTYGIMIVIGITLGSLVYSLLKNGFHIEWFSSLKDFITHIAGGILMGFGGVLAMGCTLGQGVTGISTLSAGSFITFGAIVLGGILTVKMQYYLLVYENDASFIDSLVSTLADLNLYPESLRKLEKV